MNKTNLRLPFAGEWLVLNGGDTKELNHHYDAKAQKYAFDFTKVNKGHRSYENYGEANDDYYCFGEPIYSPASGLVIEAVDGVADNIPGTGNYLSGAGNYIIIKHSDNEYSFIAHLRQGSLQVKVGDNTKAGQPLGECGNSGTSFAPHLHYHLQDSPTLVRYSYEYDPTDRTRGNFPIKIDYVEIAAGLRVEFSDIAVNGISKSLYSPQQGDFVRMLT